MDDKIWPVGENKNINVTGYFFAAQPDEELGLDQPVLTEFPHTPVYFLSIFSTVEKLHQMMKIIGISDYKIKRIMDAKEFTQSIFEAGVRIAADPWINDKGNTRFTEVKNDIAS